MRLLINKKKFRSRISNLNLNVPLRNFLATEISGQFTAIVSEAENAICLNKHYRAAANQIRIAKKMRLCKGEADFTPFILSTQSRRTKKKENLLRNRKVCIISQYPHFTPCGFFSEADSETRRRRKKVEEKHRSAAIIKADEIAFISLSVASFILIHSKTDEGRELKRLRMANLFAQKLFIILIFLPRFA